MLGDSLSIAEQNQFVEFWHEFEIDFFHKSIGRPFVIFFAYEAGKFCIIIWGDHLWVSASFLLPASPHTILKIGVPISLWLVANISLESCLLNSSTLLRSKLKQLLGFANGKEN